MRRERPVAVTSPVRNASDAFSPAGALEGIAGEPAVEIRGLRKTFGTVVALDRIDLQIPRAAVGLLGANGAGKTTLLRILLGLSEPTQGSANVLGYDTRAQGVKVRELVGYMPESDALPGGTTAADFVSHMAEMSGLPARAARQRAADVLYHVGLDEERYRLIKGFSTGMKQRVKLAQALVHDPGLVFLDEPTNGMDPRGRDEMLDLIKRIHTMLGIAVIVSSHILEDIERVCDYVVILSGGKLVLAQPLAGIGMEQGDLLVRVDERHREFINRLNGLGIPATMGTGDELHGREEITVRFDGDHVYDIVRDTAAEMEIALRSLRKRARSLEDIYIGEVDRPSREEAPSGNA
ncbi:MAG: ABC transporter ATP-binding protein [Thermomicrobiales bacterium]|nr:ABC transporter ATP-binding protein [Thermomicrobiales bacterium]